MATRQTQQIVADDDWHRALAQSIRNSDVLIDWLGLPETYREPARRASQLFPLFVPESYLNRIQPNNPLDPLLLQVLPLAAESDEVAGFTVDAVGDEEAHHAPGLLQKYEGRALLITTGTCAIHCRYCFRRHYPYGEEPRRVEEWEPAFQAIAADSTLHEIILSGGDPLMLTDSRLAILLDKLAGMEHVRRIRIHTRLPIVLPNRVTPPLIELLANDRFTMVMVVHANHPNELVGDCAIALRRLANAGVMLLNQAVLLRDINDSVDVQAELSERLIDVGVLPYYLHQLDRVSGTAHFEVSEREGRELIAQLRQRLPGYAIPRYVREVPGVPFKEPLSF